MNHPAQATAATEKRMNYGQCQAIKVLAAHRMNLDPACVADATARGPLVFSAITGGTQTQHWRGGGVGRSLILLAFLFTFKSGIRGVKP